MIVYHIHTRQRFLPVIHWVNVVFLSLFYFVCNIGYTLSARCIRSLLCVISLRILWNFILTFHRNCIQFVSPLGVMEYLHDLMLNKKYPIISYTMYVLRCNSFFLWMWNTILVGMAFCCLVGVSNVFKSHSCCYRMKYL